MASLWPRFPSSFHVNVPPKIATLIPQDYVTFQDIIADINSTGRANAKVALVLSGGGAKGAYEAGAVEAMLQLNLVPDIIVGTSAGSLVSLPLFADLLYPFSDPASPYKAGQSNLWRNLAKGNNAAATLFNNAWLIDLMSGKPNPLTNALQGVKNVIGDFSKFFKQEGPTLQADWKAFINAVEANSTVSKAVTNAQNTIAAVKQDITNMGVDLDPTTTKRHYWQLSGDAKKLFKDLGLEGEDLWDVLTAIFDKIAAILGTFEKLAVDAAADLAVDTTALAAGIGALAVILPAGFLLIELLAPYLIIAGFEYDHILDNTGLKIFVDNYMRSAVQRAKSIPSGTAWSSVVVADWIHLASGGAGPRPELILTTTDLRAQRQVLFTIAKADTVRNLAQNDRWVVDMAGVVPVPDAGSTQSHVDNVFNAAPATPSMETQSPVDAILGVLAPSDPLLLACITSTSIPFAFQPQYWNMRGWVKGKHYSFGHFHVDGGVVDNTALDVALEAGATHIICIQLNSFRDTRLLSDDSPYPIFTMAGQLLENILANGPLRNTIDGVIGENAKGGSQVHIYRLAPPEDSDTIDTLDFDGHYATSQGNIKLTMNLYDLFMHGYIDVKGFSGPNDNHARTDGVFQDYLRNGASLGCAQVSSFQSDAGSSHYGDRKFWYARQYPEPS